MSDVVYLTREKINDLQKELHDLKVRGRKEIAQIIAEARALGDLSENAEYDAAKEKQRLMELRIAQLENTLAKARIIESGDLPNDKVYILSVVTLLDLNKNEKVEYTLVSPEESNYEEGKISVTSPIGKSLLGKKVNDEVTVKVPAGVLKYKILDIKR
ncbi:MAG TPA: transcription elongation factor GreA [Bacteroidota bacterium]|jgi:transcription elongation factor GreA|nr:transcription elongation factor GreA [Bacteroidota bacterium]